MRRKGERRPLRMVILITQLGINMLVPIFLCAWLGIKIVGIFHIDILFPCFLLLGILAGFRTCYMTITRFVSLGQRRTESSPKSQESEEKNPADRGLRKTDLRKNEESNGYEVDKMDKGNQ